MHSVGLNVFILIQTLHGMGTMEHQLNRAFLAVCTLWPTIERVPSIMIVNVCRAAVNHLYEHLIQNLFSLQCSSIVRHSSTHPAACHSEQSNKEKNRNTPLRKSCRYMSQKPQILRRPQNSQACTSFIPPPTSFFSLLSPSSSLIIHPLWTGLFSAAGRPLCTCWQPL